MERIVISILVLFCASCASNQMKVKLEQDGQETKVECTCPSCEEGLLGVVGATAGLALK